MTDLLMGLIQMDCVLGDIKTNCERAVTRIQELAGRGAHMALLPELFATGYHPRLAGDWNRLAQESENVLKLLKAQAKDLGIWLITPLPRRGDEGKVYNSACAINNQGQVVTVYDKAHLFAAEKDYFTPGQRLTTFQTPWGKMGLLICYDALFPEMFRCLALSGVELVILPAAWRDVELDIWDIALPARALENTVFLAAVNRVGVEGELRLFGRSLIVDPRGTMLARGATGREDLVLASLDIQGGIARYRQELRYLHDRRTDLFTRYAAEGVMGQ